MTRNGPSLGRPTTRLRACAWYPEQDIGAKLTLAHIRNLETVTLMGGPWSPRRRPSTTTRKPWTTFVNHTVGRVLDLFGMDVNIVKHREGMRGPEKS